MLVPFIILAVLFVVLAALTIGITNSLLTEINTLKEKVTTPKLVFGENYYKARIKELEQMVEESKFEIGI